jgi:Family of unknown function (DUF5677)
MMDRIESAPPYISDILPELLILNDEILKLCELIINISSENYNEKNFPLSRGVFERLHYEAISMHKGIIEICSFGRSNLAGILLRTPYDLLITLYVIAEKDNEYRAFKYLFWELLKNEISEETAGYSKAIAHLSDKDKSRAIEYIDKRDYRNYWFNPDFNAPTDVIKKRATATNDLFSLYRMLSNISHGGYMGIKVFKDNDDKPNINPISSPKSANLVVLTSGRLLLEICHLRIQYEALGIDSVYSKIMSKYIALGNTIKIDK